MMLEIKLQVFIHYDLEYPNVLMCSMRGRAGQIVGQGFSGKKTQMGVKMSKTVKKIGCINLKSYGRRR
jgi:hypothetical protein